MSDTDANGSPVIAAEPVAAAEPVVVAADPVVVAPVTPVAATVVEVDFDKLKALLIAYGHKIGSEYEQFLAMVKK